MKTTKILMTAFLMLFTISAAKADNDRPVTFNQLPETSKTFIKKYFNEKDISYAKMEEDLFSKSYEVFFVNGTKVEFNKNGEWKEVTCIREKIPAGIVPAQITTRVKKDYPDLYIVKIERDKKDYEIELNNDLEIKFDPAFNIIGYDN